MKKTKVVGEGLLVGVLPPLIDEQFCRDSDALIGWYRSIKRDLPWRKDRDPYRIWVSEVMLQQTTVTAVIPFYERFMKRFPNLKALATADVGDVVEHWAGLGYYSRARNLHRSAQELYKRGGFPKTHAELIELPGFGPYTARAVSSLAFDEKTGVLDGNVIRVLSRRFGLMLEWWKPQARAHLQHLADKLAQTEAPADLNQGMMELGATVCTPQSPTCLLCPWNRVCIARNLHAISNYPMKRPRREREIWAWQMDLVYKQDSVLLVPNEYAPFLKGHLVFPGKVERLKKVPTTFTYKGCVTHYDIFVTVNSRRPTKADLKSGKWVSLSQIEREIPASILRKAIERGPKEQQVSHA